MKNPKSFDMLVDAITDCIKSDVKCNSFTDLDIDIQRKIAAQMMIDDQFPLDFLMEGTLIENLPAAMFVVMTSPCDDFDAKRDQKLSIFKMLEDKCLETANVILEHGDFDLAHSIAVENDSYSCQLWSNDND